MMNGMKTNEKLNDAGNSNTARTVCFASCRKLNTQVAGVKESILEEFQGRVPGNGQVVVAAVNEAEALAWQTPYPHLFFPTLAREKAMAATRWAARQMAVKRASSTLALAA